MCRLTYIHTGIAVFHVVFFIVCVCVYKLIVSFRGLNVSPPDLWAEYFTSCLPPSHGLQSCPLWINSVQWPEWTLARWRLKLTFHIPLLKSLFWPLCRMCPCLHVLSCCCIISLRTNLKSPWNLVKYNSRVSSRVPPLRAAIKPFAKSTATGWFTSPCYTPRNLVPPSLLVL